MMTSESENQSDRAPREIESPLSVDVDDVEREIAERPKITNLTAHADVVPKEEHCATAKIKGGFAVVEAQHITERIDLRANHTKTHEPVRTKANALLTAD